MPHQNSAGEWRFSPIEELENMAAGFEAVSQHLMKEFWKDRRKHRNVARAEVYDLCAARVREALKRLDTA